MSPIYNQRPFVARSDTAWPLSLLYPLAASGLLFWQPTFFPAWDKLSPLIFFSIFVISMSLRPMPSCKKNFMGPLMVFYLGVIFALLSGMLFWKQDFPNLILYISKGELLLAGTYFALHNISPSPKKIKQMLLIFTLITTALFLLQNVLSSTHIFGILSDDVRGTEVRVRIAGSLLITLAALFSFNQYLIGHYRYLFIYLASIITIFMQGFRTNLFAIGVSSIFMLFATRKSHSRAPTRTILIIFSIIGLGASPIGSKYINSFVDLSVDQLKENNSTENIRLQELKFFYSIDQRPIPQIIFGTGFPAGLTPDAKYYSAVESDLGYYRNDLGLLGYFLFAGITTIAGIALIFSKALSTQLPPDSLYLKTLFLYLILTSLTTAEFWRFGSFFVQGCVLYLIDISDKSDLQGINSTMRRTI